jgi:hypothetical protein
MGTQIQALFMLQGRKSGTITLGHVGSRRAQARIRYSHAGSRWLVANSGLHNHNLSCLLIAPVTPLRNSRSNQEKALCESRFHLIVIRYCMASHTFPNMYLDPSADPKAKVPAPNCAAAEDRLLAIPKAKRRERRREKCQLAPKAMSESFESSHSRFWNGTVPRTKI